MVTGVAFLVVGLALRSLVARGELVGATTVSALLYLLCRA